MVARFLRGGAAQGSSSLSQEARLRRFLPLLEEPAGSGGLGSEQPPFTGRWLGLRLGPRVRM